MTGTPQTPGALRCRFWGVRGSTPAPSPRMAQYGGNTPCMEVRSPTGELFIFDAGTGIRELGLSLAREEQLRTHIFLTHFHWDHIQGIPFYAPIYDPDATVRFYSTAEPVTLQQLLRGQMAPPYFPFPYDVLPGRQDCEQFRYTPQDFGSVTIHPFGLTHPQGCSGFRISCGNQVIVYATDHEHGNAETDRNLRDMSQGADILIYDAQYTPEEYPAHFGWGHSTWQEGVSVARDSGAKQLVLFHHDPDRDDAGLADMEDCTRQFLPQARAAREGEWLYCG